METNILTLRQKRAGLVKDLSAVVEDGEKFNAVQASIDALDEQMIRVEKVIAIEKAQAAALAVTSTPIPETNAVTATHVSAVEPSRRFGSFGEQLQFMVEAARPGGFVDPRLQKYRAAPTGASEGIAGDAGFLVQDDYAASIYTRMYQTGEILSRCDKTTLSANSNGLVINAIDETSRVTGSRYGAVQGYWIAEGVTPTSSRPKFRQIRLNAKKVAALYYATDELLADASVLEQFVTKAMIEELTFLTEDAIVNGSGAGQPLGILNSPALVTQNKAAAQATLTFVTQNATDMFTRMWARSFSTAVWLVNQDTMSQIFTMTLGGTAAASPMFYPPGGIGSGPGGSLLGRPIIPVEYCASLTNVGDVILADLSQYQVVDKGGPQAAMSIHVQFINDETVFRFIYRVDGSPKWHAPLTPFKGTNTQSPFVALQAR